MTAYKNGFGWLSCNGESDYWIGLDYMSAMSYRQSARLRIDLKDWDNADYWGYYDKFFVLPESRGYKLIADQYSGVGSYSIGDAWGGVAFGGRRKNKGKLFESTLLGDRLGDRHSEVHHQLFCHMPFCDITSSILTIDQIANFIIFSIYSIIRYEILNKRRRQ